jgi:hypothetical protein
VIRFSIRDVLWLTALIAATVAWQVDRRRAQFWSGKAAALIRALETREAFIGWQDVDSAQAILRSPTNEIPSGT